METPSMGAAGIHKINTWNNFTWNPIQSERLREQNQDFFKTDFIYRTITTITTSLFSNRTSIKSSTIIVHTSLQHSSTAKLTLSHPVSANLRLESTVLLLWDILLNH